MRKVRLRSDWRTILRRAWSVRLILLASLLTGLEAALPFLPEMTYLPPGTLAAIASVVTGLALLARVVAQRDMGDKSDE